MQSVTSRLETSLYQNFSYYFESFDSENFGLDKKSQSRSQKNVSVSVLVLTTSLFKDQRLRCTIYNRLYIEFCKIYLAHHYCEEKMIVTAGLTE